MTDAAPYTIEALTGLVEVSVGRDTVTLTPGRARQLAMLLLDKAGEAERASNPTAVLHAVLDCLGQAVGVVVEMEQRVVELSRRLPPI